MVQAIDISQLMFAAAVVMFATAFAVGIAKRLAIGSIVGLLAVGVVLGPHSPKPLLTGHIQDLQAVGEIGVVLLLFAVGVDVQPKRLWSMRRLVFGLGSLQYALTTAAILAFVAAIVGVGHVHWQSVLIVALGLAFSSSAVPLPILEERGETETMHGRAVIAIDILQGFMVVPVLAMIPLLGAASFGTPAGQFGRVIQAVGAIAGVFVLGRYLVPWALTLMARRIGPSGFVMIVLSSVLFAAWWMEVAGMSMALGAFMMGVLLSTTVFSDQVKAAVAPAKRLLLAIFFIAIGMAIDPAQVLALKADLLLYLPTLLLIKFVILFGLARAFGIPLRSAILVGLLMMPFDEIAYVMLASANASGLLGARDYTVGITVISFSFVVSPLLINLGFRLIERPQRHPAASSTNAIAAGSVVVAGCGDVGRAICAMLERASVPYAAFESDAAALDRARTAGHSVQYGDLTNVEMLETLAIRRARLVIVTMRTFSATRQLVSNMRQFYPDVHAISAVQFLEQRDELTHLGATRVVALAPQGTLSFGSTVLERLGLPPDRIQEIVASIEAGDYAMLRGVTTDEPRTTVEMVVDTRA